MRNKKFAILLIVIFIGFGAHIMFGNKNEVAYNPNWEFEEGQSRSESRFLDSKLLHEMYLDSDAVEKEIYMTDLRIQQSLITERMRESQIRELIKDLRDSTEVDN